MSARLSLSTRSPALQKYKNAFFSCARVGRSFLQRHSRADTLDFRVKMHHFRRYPNALITEPQISALNDERRWQLAAPAQQRGTSTRRSQLHGSFHAPHTLAHARSGLVQMYVFVSSRNCDALLQKRLRVTSRRGKYYGTAQVRVSLWVQVLMDYLALLNDAVKQSMYITEYMVKLRR